MSAVTVRNAGDASALGTVLGVWAHPDDEAYLSAGLMALARRAGQRVVCVTATRGEHGTADPVLWPPSRLAGVRTQEMAAAMTTLGVDEHRWLEFEDGTLDRVPLGRGAGIVAALIDDVRPDTVVTFGPDGMTGHPDHLAVSAWVQEAAHRDAPSLRVLHATTTASFVDEFADVHATLGLFGDGLPPRTPDRDLAVVVELDDDVADVKLTALEAHASQVQPIIDLIGADQLRRWWRTERFAQAGKR